jgi:hypothetical protein
MRRKAGCWITADKLLTVSWGFRGCSASVRRLAERGWRAIGTERAPPEAPVTMGPAQHLTVHH